jgi:DNA-binding winged helix-turn-helix (wHTH) protein/Tol biopolymer transport system component
MAETQSRPRLVRFGAFEADMRTGELRKDGVKLKFSGQPFQVLAILLERPGDVVTREELQKRLWPDTFVDVERNLNTAINKIREMLGDSADVPHFIETLPRRGYRFIGRLEAPPDMTPLDSNGAVNPSQVGSAVALPLLPQVDPLPKRETSKDGSRKRFQRWLLPGIVALGGVVAFLAVSLSFRERRTVAPSRDSWAKVTDFSDSATSPAFSPDGRMIAFIRGPDTFITRGQIYVKMLPEGQPVQLTHDDRLKMAPAFSPDGSRIAYTATESNYAWNSWVVPVLGGEPEMLLPNAAALTWVDRQHVMYSEAKTGFIMGLATASESRTGERDIYVPTYIKGMVHRSEISPDGKWVLAAEMDGLGWLPCRVVPFDGSSAGEPVGPQKSRCTYAGWSPDGGTMYFSADAGDGFHIWRQRFPHGVPEQMTFGPTEEEGIAVAPDGGSLVTSAGIRESTVWVHDARGDRQVSGEGYATVPGLGFGGGADVRTVFSPDGKRLFYLLRTQASRGYMSGELWMTDLESGASAAVLPGILMTEFHISPDGERVAFAAQDAQEVSHVWVAPLDRHMPPKQLTSLVSRGVAFGPGDDIHFVAQDGKQEFLFAIGSDETLRRKMSPEPIDNFGGISPSGEWLLGGAGPVIGTPLRGGPAIRFCSFCGYGWAPDRRLLYLRFRDLGEMGGGKTIVISLPPGRDLPPIPKQGFQSIKDTKGLNVVAGIDTVGITVFAPGPNPSVYAYSRTTVQRNLFRIPLK